MDILRQDSLTISAGSGHGRPAVLRLETMRRAIAVLAGVALLALASAAIARADGGPHGEYSATADGCAGCHRAHTATGPSLLVSSNTALCLTCHGTGSTGAETNVADGVYEGNTLGTQNAGMNGGGFVNARQDTSLSGTAAIGATTSSHSVQGMAGYSNVATMWGAGASGSGAGSSFDLYCTSCHDPHGSSSYRMLRTTVNGVAVAVAKTDETSKSYTSTTYHKPDPGAGQWEISAFCGACHTRYMATSGGSGGTASGDAIYAYRHRTDAPSGSVVNTVPYSFPEAIRLPVSTVNGGAPSVSPDNRLMVCLTCHVSHGTRAQMGSISGAVSAPGGAGTPGGSVRSSLLRLDNRGVCQNCHPK